MYEVFIDNKAVVFDVKSEEELLRQFRDYKFIEAAGGLVEHGPYFLFIRRNGFWDIPKGKLESGEKPEHGAVREIEEECGLNSPLIVDHLLNTFHTYVIKGQPVLKKTYWYRLKSTEKYLNLLPQLEEGITEVKLVKPAEFAKIKDHTFKSIEAVISALQKKNWLIVLLFNFWVFPC